MVAVQWLVGDNGDACTSETLSESIELLDEERRMSLLGRAKVSLDAEMHSQGAALEPRTATFREIGGLGDFGEAEDA